MKKEILLAEGKPRKRAPKVIPVPDDTAAAHGRLLLEIQRDLAMDLCAAQDPGDAFGRVLAAAIRLPGLDCGTIHLRDHASGALELVAHHGLAASSVRAAKSHPGDSPQARWAATGEFVYVAGPDLPVELAADLATEGLAALAILPLKVQGQVIGVLQVSSHHPAWFAPEARLALETLAAQAEAAMALIQARVAGRTAELEASNAALREESMRLEWALEAAQAGTSKIEMGVPTMKWDNRERALFGFAQDAPVLVEDLMARVHPDDCGAIYDHMQKPVPPGGHNDWNHEFRIIHPVTGIRWIAGIGRIWRDAADHKIHIAGINFDITERKRAEQAMREWNETLERRVAERTLQLNQSEARFRQLAAASFEGIVVSDVGHLLDANQQFAELHGYQLAELAGRPVADFIAPESRALVARRIREGNEDAYELVALRKDGSTFPAQVHGRDTTWNGTKARVSVIRDLSAAKQTAARLRVQQTELEHASRLALVSEISAGVMHQIAQPLTAITTNVAAVRSRVSACATKGCNSLEILKDVAADLTRIRQTMAHFRTLAHPERLVRGLIRLPDLLPDVLKILREEARIRAFQITLDHADQRLELRVDKVQIEQVLLNLVRNSFEAAGALEAARRLVKITTRAVDHGNVEICVRDAGPGIPPEDLPRLFSPFFTTKREGLGIGLRLSQTIVCAHGGTIEGFNHGDGPGATFRVVLPTAQAS